MDNARTIRSLAEAMATTTLSLGEVETLAFLCTCYATKGEIQNNGLSFCHVGMLEKRGLVKQIERNGTKPFIANETGREHIDNLASKVKRALVRNLNLKEPDKAEAS